MLDMVHTQVIVLTQEQHITTGEDFIPQTNLEDTLLHVQSSLKQTHQDSQLTTMLEGT